VVSPVRVCVVHLEQPRERMWGMWSDCPRGSLAAMNESRARIYAARSLSFVRGCLGSYVVAVRFMKMCKCVRASQGGRRPLGGATLMRHVG
jgi:hypothetical protein